MPAKGSPSATTAAIPVSNEYKPKFQFSGGCIVKVIYDVADDVYIDLERKFAAAMARD